VVLLVLVLVLAFTRRGEYYWPIVTWPVYSLIKPKFPKPSTSLLEARVTTASGASHVLRAPDLVEVSRLWIAERVLDGAVSGDDRADRRALDRAHLARLVGLALGHRDFDTIEVWRVEWEVDPLGHPPLTLSKPSGQTLRARFTTPSPR
jgi:hypothetical protein